MPGTSNPTTCFCDKRMITCLDKSALTCLIGSLGPQEKSVVGSSPKLRAFSGKLWRPWTLWFECGFEVDGSRITLETLDTLV